MTPEEQLEREAAARRWAVPATMLAALVPFAGALMEALVRRDDPSVELTGQLLFTDKHAGALSLAVAVQGIGLLFVGAALVFLYDAVRARRPEVPPLARIAAIAGPVILLVAQTAFAIVLGQKAHDFANHGAQTYQEAKDAVGEGLVTALQYGILIGRFLLGFAFVVICLNAIRVGLLTRFLGTVGIIVGVLAVLPLLGPVPVVQAFWLGALLLVVAGRWPGGVPPAWASGRAEPWPSQQDLREARDRQRAGPADEPEAPAAPEPATAAPAHPASKKRKRKRRR
jgi:hypothetical protein